MRGPVPQALKTVKTSCVVVKNMHDQIGTINQHPGALLVSLHSQRFLAMLREFFSNGVSNGAHLTVRGTAANEKIIGYRGQLLHIQHDDIFSLSTVCRERTALCLFCKR